MRKPTSFEIAYNALSRIESGKMSEEAVSELRNVLRGRSSLLVSRAADIAGRRGVQELVSEMISAFDRFMIDAPRVDKTCGAKTSIAQALNKLEYMGDEVFLAGARHVQMEPAFGGPVDTAVGLRSECAFALVRINSSDAQYVLTELLVDPESAVRSAAARALSCLGCFESELLLRLKVLTGDQEADVIHECLQGLMVMAPENSFQFVVRCLKSEDSAIAQYAALVIGESRMPQAFAALKKHWDDSTSHVGHRALLLPIALVRNDEAFGFLLDILRTSDATTAAEALSSLSIYTTTEHIARISEVVKGRNDPDLAKLFDYAFDRSSD